jgi:glycerol uptake facilitator-like aquaporin
MNLAVTVRHAWLAEFGGTATLLAIVVGSGIMGEQLAQGNAAIALLANAAATGAGLYVLITLLGPVSGAHFNPMVTAAMWWRGDRTGAESIGYIVAQVAGAIGIKVRSGIGQWVSEAIATAGLLSTILLALHHRSQAIPALVGAYITAAYWFTASTSFANPAVTIARALTRTFAGIRPADVGGFILAQFTGSILVLAAAQALRTSRVVTPSVSPSSESSP